MTEEELRQLARIDQLTAENERLRENLNRTTARLIYVSVIVILFYLFISAAIKLVTG